MHSIERCTILILIIVDHLTKVATIIYGLQTILDVMTALYITDLPTPIVLVDLEKLMNNIWEAARKAKLNGKILWPMFKTSKSTYIAKLQKKAGANGFLCGTITEAEALINSGVTSTVMLAYPIADKENFNRIANLIENGARVILRIDNLDVAEFLDNKLEERKLKAEYCIKVDVGYHRYGVKPENVGKFAKKLEKYSNLKFIGIATHQGNAYKAKNPKEVEEIAKQAAQQMQIALKSLKANNLEAEIVGAGSTPTFRFDVKEPIYTHLFPGNYIYYDRTQALAYGSAKLENCALTLLATITSIPEHSNGKTAIINAGSKYIDKQIRGNIKGYGQAIKHPKAIITAVSQEVAKLDITKEKHIKVGQKINIITNHACHLNNATNLIIAHKKGKITKIISIDAKTETNLEKLLLNVLIK